MDLESLIIDQDQDQVAVVSINDGQYGTIHYIDQNWVYRPFADVYGRDYIDVVIQDEHGAKNTIELIIDVNPINDLPTLHLEQMTGFEDRFTYLSPMAWATDVDQDELTIHSFTQASFGRVEQVGDYLAIYPIITFMELMSFLIPFQIKMGVLFLKPYH